MRTLLLALLLARALMAANQERVVQTNSAGDNVHVIDPVTNKVVGIIQGIEVPHGVALAPDGSRIYITDESLSTLDVMDAGTLKVTKRIKLSGRPNNLAVSRDGKFVYVAIAQAPGAVDVIDAATGSDIKSIKVKGAIHNVYVTPDGKFAVAGSIPTKTVNVIDTATNTLAWTSTLSAGIRPMVFTTNADVSTKQIILQLSDYHGIVVVDFATHEEVKRIPLPDPAGQEKETEGIQGSPSHGLAITPDGKTLWATSKMVWLCGRLFFARFQTAESCAGRLSSGVADHSAGWKELVCGVCGRRRDCCCRQQDPEGGGKDRGWCGAETQYQRDAAHGLISAEGSFICSVRGSLRSS